MSEVAVAVIKVPIPYSSKHVWLAVEEDHLDHDDQIVQIGDMAFGAVCKRKPEHPSYKSRMSDSLQIIMNEFPRLDDEVYDSGAGGIRDAKCGIYIY